MRFVALFLTVLLVAGCQTAAIKKQGQPSSETNEDVLKAVGSMTEGLTQQNISQEDLKRLGAQIQKDPQAKSAVESVNKAMQAHQTGIRYCPVDGKRYSDRVKVCPRCGTTLKDLEE